MHVNQVVSEHTGLVFYASAYYKFDDQLKKHSPVFLADKTPLSTLKNFNVTKTYLGERSESKHNIVVIDIDGIPPQLIEERLPELKHTLTTTTTKAHHKHYYLIVPEDFPSARIIGCQLATSTDDAHKFDILSSGIVAEGYPMSVVDNAAPMQRATPETIVFLKSYIAATTYNTAPRGAFYKNRAYARSIEEAVDSFPTNKTDMKKLLKATVPIAIFNANYKSSKGKIKFPALSYQMFNDMATKLSYNIALTHTVRDQYLNMLLTDVYELQLNSSKTQQILHKQILPSLPRNEYIEEDEDAFAARLEHTRIGNFYTVKYIVEKQMNYAQLNARTLKMRQIGKHGTSGMSSAALLAELPMSKEDLDMIPTVKLVDDPFARYIEYDEEHEITTLNVTFKTVYEEQATPSPDKPDNCITRLIHSVLGKHFSYSKHEGKSINSEELYYHWLSWMIFSPKEGLLLVPVMATHQLVAGGTGKSHVLGTIPDRLCGSIKTASEKDIDSGWGDLVIGTKGILFNDLKDKKYWDAIVGFIKDYGTASLRRTTNLKKGNMMTLDIPKLMSSISCNFLPSVDPSDRRLWFLKPQHIDGNTERLTTRDVAILDGILGDKKTHHEEFQELANYLMYLFQNEQDKFIVELTAYAPHTEYRDAALLEDKNYSSRVLPAIAQGPDQLEAIMNDHTELEFFYAFILFQYKDIGESYITLPYQFMDAILEEVREREHESAGIKKAGVASALGIEVDSIKNHTSDKRGKNFKAEFECAADYTEGGQLKIVISASVIEKYRARLRQIKNKDKQ